MKLTDSAQLRLKQLLSEENNPEYRFRVFIQGGGCSGMQYGFTFDDQQNEDDFDFQYDGFVLLVDSISIEYLRDADIDYREDNMGASFVINNPQATTTCGCGSSFSI